MYSDLDSLTSGSHLERNSLTGSSHLLSYTRLEKKEISFVRPVLILGPFAQSIIEKLSSDHPSKFVQCLPEYMNSDLKTVEKVNPSYLRNNKIYICFRALPTIYLSISRDVKVTLSALR